METLTPHSPCHHRKIRKCSSSLALILLLSALSAFADDAVNIDCGSSRSYKDGNDIEWVGDGDYTQSGKPMTVMTNSLSDELVMNTLQVFSTAKKNCYSIPSVSQQQVLVRASFYYGNYDNKSSPPTFDLLLDDNPWDTVVTSSSKTVRYEAIYVVKGNIISVCVSQTSDRHIPFMSALEIRSMSTDMYKYFDPNTALFTRDRSYISDTAGSLLLDSSGRIWQSIDVPSDMIMEASDSTLIEGTTAADNPPEEVLQHAATVQPTSSRLSITSGNLPTSSVPVYVNLYFSEVAILDPTTQQRLFHVYVDDQLLTDQPIAPPYATVYEIALYNFTANSTTLFSLVATKDSTLPPIINAFEVFVVSDVLLPPNTDDDGSTTTTPDTAGSDGTTTTGNSNKKKINTGIAGQKKKMSKLPVVLGTTIPSGAIFSAILGFLARRHQKRKSAALAAISNMVQTGVPNVAPIVEQAKEFVVQMTGEAVMNSN